MTKRIPSEAYLEKAASLTPRQVEFLMMRMGGKLGRRLDDHKLVPLEALAIQLEIEDEHRAEWRARFAEVRSFHNKNRNASTGAAS